MKSFKPTKKELLDFGLLMAFVFAIIGGIFFWKDNFGYFQILSLSGIFLLTALLQPFGLALFFKIWMTLARGLGVVITGVIMSALFYIVFTPIGLLMRLLGKRPLDVKWPDDKASYWHMRENKDMGIEDYERQF